MSQVEATYDIPLGSECADGRQVADPEQSTASRTVRAGARSGAILSHGPCPTNLDMYACPLDLRRGTTGKCQAGALLE